MLKVAWPARTEHSPKH